MGKNFTYVRGAAFPYQYKYEHMAVTTDCVIFTWEDNALKVLLVRRGGEPYKGAWAFPGGFLKMDETSPEGALRELREETALERLRRDIHFEPVGFNLLNEEFSIPELQRLYEAILGVNFDRRNFQRKILATGILEEAEAPEESEEPGEYTAAPCPAPPMMMDMCCRMEPAEPRGRTMADLQETTPPARKRSRGRIASLFRLNHAQYAKMKEDGGKMEF